METHELVIHRTNYSAVVTLDGVQGRWMWEIPVAAPTNAVEYHTDGDTVYYRVEEGGDWYARQCHKRALTPTMLLSQLTFVEARELMGYCQHVADQLGTHLGFLHVALGEALAEKHWPVMVAQINEMLAALGAQAIATETARLCYEALDREPVK